MIWQDTERQRAAAQPGKRAHSWEVRHAGLLGLKYLVAVRKDLFAVQANEGYITESSIYSVVQGPNLLKDALDVAILGLRDTDDDVRGVAASALLPILPELVHGLPSEDFLELLDVIYLCLSDLKDDLSSSVGNVMDLLAGLIRFPLVLELLQEPEKGCVSHRLRTARLARCPANQRIAFITDGALPNSFRGFIPFSDTRSRVYGSP